MRIFKRLQRWNRGESNIERKLLESIIGDLLRRIEDRTEVVVLPKSKSACCSCCSAEAEAQVHL